MSELRRERMKAMPRHVLYSKRAIEPVVHDVHSRERKLRADLVRDPGEDRDCQESLLFRLGRYEFHRPKVRHSVKGL